MSARRRHEPWFLEGVGQERRIAWRIPGAAFCEKHEKAHATSYRGHCWDCEREEQFGEAYRRWECTQMEKLFADDVQVSA